MHFALPAQPLSVLGPKGAEATFVRTVRPLLVADLCFIALHIVLTVLFATHVVPRTGLTRLFLISVDHSVAEVFMYLKWGAAAGLMAIACFRHGGRLCAAFAMVLCILLADDSLRLHEGIGKSLATSFGFPAVFGLRAQDLGELAVWAVLGAAIIFLILLGLARAGARELRLAPYVLATLALLVVAGIGIDMVHVAITDALPGRVLRAATDLSLTLLEDGGELLLSSLMVGYAQVAASAHPIWPRQGAESVRQPA